MTETLLAGTRVLELSTGVAGGFCARILADLGADVLRLEPPPPATPPGERGLETWLRANKRVKPAAGVAELTGELERLAADAEILVTDLAPRQWPAALPALDELQAAYPRLVLAAITPFGRHGPYAGFRSADLVALALSGYMYVCGANEREPLRPGSDLVQILAGANAAAGALIALRYARETGHGQIVDVTMLETMTSCGTNSMLSYPNMGVVQRRPVLGMVGAGSPIACADGHAFISAGRATGDDLFLLLQDPRLLEETFAAPASRQQNLLAFYAIVREAIAGRSKAEVCSAGQDLRMQFAMVQSPGELAGCPQHAARRFFQPLALPGEPDLPAPGIPIVPPVLRRRAAAITLPEAETASWLPVEQAPAAPRTGQPRRHALTGLHVVELSVAWAGPFAGRMLADHGATVIKVESRRHPDSARGSPYVDLSYGDNGRYWERGPQYLIANSNKLHLGLEIDRPAGHAVFLDLLRWADVFIVNFTPRVLPNLGLGPEVLAEVNPRLIVLSSTGFGQGGPYERYSAWGWGQECMCGCTFRTGYRDQPDPITTPPTAPDIISAMFGATAVLAALEERERTGRGRSIDLSQYEVASLLSLQESLRAALTGDDPARLGNRHQLYAPQGVYACAGNDDWLAIAIERDEEWPRLCRAIGREDLAAQPALATHQGRQAAHELIDAALAGWTSSRSKHEAMQALQQHRVPAGAVLNSKELQYDPQLAFLRFFRAARATEVGLRAFPGPWQHLRATPGELATGPHDFGEDNEYVLRELLGYDEAALTAVQGAGVLSTVAEAVRPLSPGMPPQTQLELGLIRGWDADYRSLPLLTEQERS